MYAYTHIKYVSISGKHSLTLTLALTHILVHSHTHTHSHKYTHTYSHSHTQTHRHIHAFTHSCIHSHENTHTNTHMYNHKQAIHISHVIAHCKIINFRKNCTVSGLYNLISAPAELCLIWNLFICYHNNIFSTYLITIRPTLLFICYFY